MIPEPLESCFSSGQSGGLAGNKPTVIRDKGTSLLPKPRDRGRRGCGDGRSNKSKRMDEGAKAKSDNTMGKTDRKMKGVR